MSADRFQFKRGTTAQVDAYLPSLGEPVYDTTTKQLKIGDGVAFGGNAIANSQSADKLSTARNITLSGSVTGAVAFDGSANVTISTSVGAALQSSLDAKAPLASPTFTGTVSGITAAMVGLGSVDNTSDVNKPVSTAQQTALNLKLNAANPTSTGLHTLTGGQIKFPSIALPSADPNTLDDYAEGTWTPTLTFATPGNLAVTYSIRLGHYTKTGREVTLRFNVTTSAFSFTTASGQLQITGLPFAGSSLLGSRGAIDFGGITKASYTNFTSQVSPSSSVITIGCSGSGQPNTTLSATDTPTGGTVALVGTITYMT